MADSTRGYAMVRVFLLLLVLLTLSACTSEPEKPEVSLVSEPQPSSWTPATVPAQAATPASAPAPAKEEGDCLRKSSLVALWSCTGGTGSH